MSDSVTAVILTSTDSQDIRLGEALRRQIVSLMPLVRRIARARILDRIGRATGADDVRAATFLITVATAKGRDDPRIDAFARLFVSEHSSDRLLLVLADDDLERLPQTMRERHGRMVEGKWVLATYAPNVTVRGKVRRKLVRDAALRLVAEMCDCDYDDLARRRVARKRKPLFAAAALLLLVASGLWGRWLWTRTPQSQLSQLLKEPSDGEVIATNQPLVISEWALALDHAGQTERAGALWASALREMWRLSVPMRYEIARKLTAAGRTADAATLRNAARADLPLQVTDQNWLDMAKQLSAAGEKDVATNIVQRFATGDKWQKAPTFRQRLAIDVLIDDERLEQARALARTTAEPGDAESLAYGIAAGAARLGQVLELEDLLREFPAMAEPHLLSNYALAIEEIAPGRADSLWQRAIGEARKRPLLEATVLLHDLTQQLEIAGRTDLAAQLHEQIGRNLPQLEREVVLPTPTLVRQLRDDYDRQYRLRKWPRSRDSMDLSIAAASILAEGGLTASAEKVWSAAQATLPSLDDNARFLIAPRLAQSLARRRRMEEASAVDAHAAAMGARSDDASEALRIWLCAAPDPMTLREGDHAMLPGVAAALHREPRRVGAAVVRAIRCPQSAARAVPYAQKLDSIDRKAATAIVRAAARQAAAIANPADRCNVTLSLAAMAASGGAAPRVRAAAANCPADAHARIVAALVISLTHSLSKEDFHDYDLPRAH